MGQYDALSVFVHMHALQICLSIHVWSLFRKQCYMRVLNSCEMFQLGNASSENCLQEHMKQHAPAIGPGCKATSRCIVLRAVTEPHRAQFIPHL